MSSVCAFNGWCVYLQLSNLLYLTGMSAPLGTSCSLNDVCGNTNEKVSLVQFLLQLLLLRSGDVETNPGPVSLLMSFCVGFHVLCLLGPKIFV